METRKIVRGIILAVLLVCTVFLIYSIVTDPLGEHDIMLPLAVTAGFIALYRLMTTKPDESIIVGGNTK